MGKLDVTILRYLTKEDFRVLTAIEMGMKNHELVPGPLAATIASLKAGGVHKLLHSMCKSRLLSYERGKKYDGYRLTNMGYDYLALKSLVLRGSLASFGDQFGIGKESNIYSVSDDDGKLLCLKLHRLGRTCFRNIKEKRDYHGKRHRASWLYLSRISATREFAYMKALYDRGFPVPKPIDFNRHCIVMELVDGYRLSQYTEIENLDNLYDDLMNLIVQLGNAGVIHGDFNEFNIMLKNDGKPVLIDFPQMVSTSHADAKKYFERDVECVRTYFKKKFGFESDDYPIFEDLSRDDNIDVEVCCSGFTKQMVQDLMEHYHGEDNEPENSDNNVSSDDEDNVSVTSLEISECDFDISTSKNEIEEYKKMCDAEIQYVENNQIRTEDSIRNYIESMTQHLGSMTIDNDFVVEELTDFEPLSEDLGERSIQVDETLQHIEQPEDKSVEPDKVEESEKDDSFGNLDPNSRMYQLKMIARQLEEVRSKRSYASSALTIDPRVLHERAKKEMISSDRKALKKSAKTKGDANAVIRKRKENKNVVKQYEGWDF